MNITLGRLPRDILGQWVMARAGSGVLHRIVWRGNNELRTGCQQVLDARFAAPALLGARLCEGCLRDQRQKERYGTRRR